MAVNFKIPDVPSGLIPGQNLQKAPALRAPTDVRFRRGANLQVVCDEITSVSHARILAAVGAGKSNYLPPALAMRSKMLVVYVTGNPLLAFSTYKFAVKRGDAGETMPPVYRYRPGIEDDMPRTGILYCGANEYVAMAIRRVAAGGLMYPHIAFLDEAHFCDAWTYVVRRLSRSLGAKVLVEASATFEPDSNIMRETDGAVQESMYAMERTSTWQVDEKGKPWNYLQVYNNVVIFTDSRSEASHLMDQYGMQGFLVHRLAANMSEADFERAMNELNDKNGVLVAIIADSSFRNGFTFNANLCVDTGRVGYYKYVPGGVVRSSRPLYHLEKVQTSGRFSRVGAGSSKYYVPEQDYPQSICDLQPVEMEVAAYVYRLLGFQPTGELSTAVMAQAFLPIQYDFSLVVNAMYPLQHYILDSQGSVRPGTPTGRDDASLGGSTLAEGARPTSSSSAGSAATTGESSGGSRVSGAASSKSSVSPAGVSGGMSVEGYFDKMREDKPSAMEISPGDYCVVRDLPSRSVSLVQFPRGIESLDTYLPAQYSVERMRQKVAGFSVQMRDAALSLVVRDYNSDNASIRALASALQQASDLGLSKVATSGYWELMAKMSEDHTVWEAHRAVNLRRLDALAYGVYRVAVVSRSLPLELELAESMLDAMRQYTGKAGGTPEDDDVRVAPRMDWDGRAVDSTGGVHDRSVVRRPIDTNRASTTYDMPWWSGCSGYTDEHGDDGGVTATTYRSHRVTRLLTGVERVRVTSKHITTQYTSGRVRRDSRVRRGSIEEEVD